MAVFKFVISEKQKSYQVEKEQNLCPVMGKKIGETFSADFLGMNGYELAITGGSDKDGFPMRKDIEGTGRKRLIVKKGIGFSGEKKIGKKHLKIEGMRKKKSLRGGIISADVTQINCKVTKPGEKPLEELLGKKEEKKEEQPAEEKK